MPTKDKEQTEGRKVGGQKGFLVSHRLTGRLRAGRRGGGWKTDLANVAHLLLLLRCEDFGCLAGTSVL